MNARIGVLGQGRMGQGIAVAAAAAGYSVNVYDVDPAALRQATTRVADGLRKLRAPAPGTVTAHQSAAELAAHSDVIYEAVPEDVELKQCVLGEASRANATALICSNTSVIPITLLAEAVAAPERFVGTHWWNPADQIRVVEVVPGELTRAETVDRACQTLETMGKTPIVLNRDVPGFIGNRLQVAIWREALLLLEEGVCDASVIDLVARETFGRRLAAVGPCENMQMIGLGLTQSILQYLLPHLSAATTPPALTSTGLGALATASNDQRLDTARRLQRHLESTAGSAATPANPAGSAPSD